MTERSILHAEGMPIRLNGQLRKDVTLPSRGQFIADMIRNSPHIGKRSEDDTLENNLGENIRLRRIARSASRELVSIAERHGIEKFCTVVHGSVARGLVRVPMCGDTSDVDIDLVIDPACMDKSERDDIRKRMFSLSSRFGARIDTYVWDLDQMRDNSSTFARWYLGASAYSLADRGNLWEKVYEAGVESQLFLRFLSRIQKRNAQKILSEIAGAGCLGEVLQMIASRGSVIEGFLKERILVAGELPAVKQKASDYLSIISR